MKSPARIPGTLFPFAAAAIFTLLLASCASGVPRQSVEAHTLETIRGLPTQDIEKLFSASEWQKLRRLEYEAFVLMDAEIRADGSLRLQRVRESFPDDSWQPLAKSFAAEAKLRAATVGSHLAPGAQVVVVFFKPALDGNLALIFARQKEEPIPGMTSRALYLHTTRYERD